MVEKREPVLTAKGAGSVIDGAPGDRARYSTGGKLGYAEGNFEHEEREDHEGLKPKQILPLRSWCSNSETLGEGSLCQSRFGFAQDLSLSKGSVFSLANPIEGF